MATFDETIRAIAEQEMPESEHHLIETFQDSTYFWANKNLSMMRSWVVDTEIMLNKTLADTDVKAFFIRLHGIVEDMHGHFSKRNTTLMEVFNTTTNAQLIAAIDSLDGDPRMKSFLKLSLKMLEKLDSVRSEFTDYELKQIMYFRHQHCHPLLTKLSVKIKKKNKRFTGVEIDRLMREIAETDELGAMAQFHPKLFGKKSSLGEMSSLLLTMIFT